MVTALLLLLVGFFALIKGADFLVSGSASLARRLGISTLAIGLTIVAFGTSMPELVVNIFASTSGANDAAFGNIIGSNNFNLLFILGIAGLIYPISVQRNTVRFEVPLSLIAALVLYFLVNDVRYRGASENLLSRWDALILLVFFIIFMIYIYRTMRTAPETEEAQVEILSRGKSIIYTVLGLLMLVIGGKLVVDNAVSLAQTIGLSQKLIGLTVLAVGTSLPELATSAVAAYRKHTDIAIGNVVGSNIFNIFFILGITGLLRPVQFNASMNFDLMVLAGGTALLIVFMFTINRRVLDRWEALFLMGGYLAYMAVLMAMEFGG